ncbi:unnamed protein product, partial [Staurois parvus]
ISALQCHPAVPPTSATHQCPAVPPISAPISATQQCHLAVPPNSASSATSQCCHQHCPSVSRISATYQFRRSVPHHQCRLISVAYQCPAVLPIHATSSVPISAAY